MSNAPRDTAQENPEEVIIPAIRDEQGRRVHRTRLTPREDTRVKVLLAKKPAPIPVVFLPGIMGTNLRNKESKDAVWRPPNTSLRPGDIVDAIGAILVWWSRGPKARQELLKASDVEVDDRGPIDPGKSGLPETAARLRGWGKAHRMYYHPFLARMEELLDHIVIQRELQAWWREEGMREPADYGEELNQARALSEDELTRVSAYQFDVWCGGYNWLQSNRQSAQDVRDYIDHTVLAYYREYGIVSAEQADKMKVIVVTHSMGGLVSRALTQLLGYERVLGVVHGVQPATGAPAIYHHMRCGYEGASQIILGANAGEVTAVVANAPGALELTPTGKHRGGRPWLFLRDEAGQVIRDADGQPRAYPRRQDPYEEIYKSAAWYGLVPAQNTKYLDMSSSASENNKRSPRMAFEKRIEAVAEFQDTLSARGYHPETYAHYAADDAAGMHSWREVIWQGNPETLEAPGAKPKDDGNGNYNGWFQRDAPAVVPTNPRWTAQGQDEYGSGGDGTVPTDSGQAPGKARGRGGVPAVRASFRHGSKGEGRYNTAKGYEHAESYGDARAQWAALYGVIKIAGLADWHPDSEAAS